MGEAARRKVQIAQLKARVQTWLDSLPPDERLVAEVARAAHESIVGQLGMVEGCYNLAFFLHEFLRREHGVASQVVIGWVNDGLWNGGASHGWIEYNGKKIDISLTKTTNPDETPPGALLILDYVVQPGKAEYTYWHELPASAVETLERMREDASTAPFLAHKDAEHGRMKAFAASPAGPAQYLMMAPPQMGYEWLARAVNPLLARRLQAV